MKMRLLRGPGDSNNFLRSTTVERSAFLPFIALAAYSHRHSGCQGQSCGLHGNSIALAGESCCSFLREFLYNPRAESSEAKRWPSNPSLPWWAAPTWISPRSMTCFRGLARRSSARNLTLVLAAKEPIRRSPRVFVEPGGQNRIIVVKGANDLLSPEDVDAAAPLLRKADTIVMQFEIPLRTVYYTV